MLGILSVLSFVPLCKLSKIVSFLQKGEWDSKYNLFKVTQLKRSRPRNSNQKCLSLDPHALLSSTLPFGMWQLRRVWIQKASSSLTGLLPTLLPFLVQGWRGAIAEVLLALLNVALMLPILKYTWIEYPRWHQLPLKWSYPSFGFLEWGHCYQWRHAKGKGHAKEKTLSLIGADVNDIVETVLWKYQLKDMILKRRNPVFTKRKWISKGHLKIMWILQTWLVKMGHVGVDTGYGDHMSWFMPVLSQHN